MTTYSSTVNPTVPVTGAAIASQPIRDNFVATANDINFIYSIIDGIDDQSIAPNVIQFGAVGDGVTDSTLAIQNAINYCISSNNRLYWPGGTYLTTASISNLHTVSHIGTGAIKRGSDLFYVQVRPSLTNILYLATTGVDTNDGLSSSYPMLTVQKPFDLLPNYIFGDSLNGTWRIKLAAGTYTEGLFINSLKSKNRIIVQGPDVGGHPNVPTAIINGTGATKQNGLFFQDYMFVQVQDIKVINFTTDDSSCGVACDAMCDMFVNNVHTSGNTMAGIDAESSSRLRLKGGIHNANGQYGVRGYSNSTLTIGYQGDAVNNRPQITNNGVAGIYFHTNVNGHIDYCDLSTNVVNILIQNESRAHVLSTTCTGASTCDLWADGYSQWYNDPSPANTFSSTTPFRHTHSSDLADQYFEIFDKTNLRMKWGGTSYLTPQNKFHYVGADGASGATFTSSAAHSVMLVENGSSCYVQLATPGGSTEAGFLFSKPSNAAYAQFVYAFSADIWKLKVAGTELYDFDATQFYPTTDNVTSLGKVANRWQHLYATDIVSATIAATTFTGALVGNASTATSATTAGNLSGTPTVPNGTSATTQTARDNSTKLATTAYVDSAASTLGNMQTKSADYTLVLTDAGVLHPSADTTARTMTIPANASVAYPLFTTLTFINQNSAGVMSIAITTDTMRLSPAGSTGTRTLAANGIAVATKITTTEWIISGSGLT